MIEQVQKILLLLITYGLSNTSVTLAQGNRTDDTIDKSGKIWEYLEKHSAQVNKTRSVMQSIDNNFRLPQEVYLKAYSFMHRSKAFGNLTFEEAANFIAARDSWQEPEYMREMYPYYFSGYDFEGRPIWIAEFGKFNIKKAVEMGSKGVADLEKYGIKACVQMLKSISIKGVKENDVRNILLITDWESMQMAQVLHLPTVAFVLDLLRSYIDIIHQALDTLVCINVNPVGEIAIGLARPVLAGLLEKFEIYGNNKAKWMVALRRILPAETIPTWYGGSKNYKPLEVFG